MSATEATQETLFTETDSTTTSLIPAEIRSKLETDVAKIMNGVTSLSITCQPEAENAITLSRDIARLISDMDQERDKLVRPKNEAVDKINAYFRFFFNKEKTGKLQKASATLTGAVQKFKDDQERKRIEAQRKAEEEARKERERIEAEARKQREKEEAARRQEEEALAKKRQAEQAALNAKTKAAREKAEAEAAEAQRIADKSASVAATASAKAEMKETIASTVVANVVQSGYQKPEGYSTVVKWTGEMTDKKALVAHLIANDMEDCIEVTMSKINKLLQAREGKIAIPGIRVIRKEDPRVYK